MGTGNEDTVWYIESLDQDLVGEPLALSWERPGDRVRCSDGEYRNLYEMESWRQVRDFHSVAKSKRVTAYEVWRQGPKDKGPVHVPKAVVKKMAEGKKKDPADCVSKGFPPGKGRS